MKVFWCIVFGAALAACSENPTPASDTTDAPKVDTPDAEEAVAAVPSTRSLAEVLDAQDEDVKARYEYRHPEQTLNFFQIKPGMSVLEALPGGGWYSKILLPYLGGEGRLIGVDYNFSIWPNFSFVNDEFLEKRKDWTTTWAADAEGWSGESGADVSAYTFSTLPTDLDQSIDHVLFIRALHNLHRFEDKGGYLTQALSETYRVLKPGGTVGVVQHEAPESSSTEWADGSRGYLKRETVVSMFENAGFTLVDSSDINANPKDQPGEEDIVWRLPPTLYFAKEDEEKRAAMMAIGESNRMTLLFKKQPQS